MELVKRLMKEEEGQGMTEYGLIIGIVAVFLITALITMRGNIAALFEGINFQQ